MVRCCSCIGNCLTGSLLLVADGIGSCFTGGLRALIGCIDCATGSGHNTARKKISWHEQRYSNKPVYRKQGSGVGMTPAGEVGAFFGEIDEAATLKASTFPIKEKELIALARKVWQSNFGTAPGHDGSCLAEDFQFVAPIVGPLCKLEFMKAFGSFHLREAFPNYAENCSFKVDPLEPNRVWFISRATGTHTGTLNFIKQYPPTGKELNLPPQAQSMLFDEQGLCYTVTVGYAMDKRIGNTEGVGGVFGILSSIGHPLPIPEGQRLYNPSMRIEAVDRFGRMVEDAGFDPMASKADCKAAGA